MQAHLPHLDGLRGLAALWVMTSHALYLTGGPALPLIGDGMLAVELFMFLSGFLMAHHYLLRRAEEPWERPNTWRIFWVRRFLRIAPLYYLLLAAAMLMGPMLHEWRAVLEAHAPGTGTPPARYLDAGMDNILMHVSFLFGLSPRYAFRTPLPDWSIGLEAQFYAVFPFLMLLMARFGAIRGALAATVACLALGKQFQPYWEAFPMPTLLPVMLHMFLCGMLLALGRQQGRVPQCLAASLAITAVTLFGLHELKTRLGLVAFCYFLIAGHGLPGARALAWPRARLHALMGGRAGHFLGLHSYCVYLLHLFILIPVAAEFARMEAYQALPGIWRAASCMLVAAPMVYGLSMLFRHYVETPGIRAGRQLIYKWRAQAAALPA